MTEFRGIYPALITPMTPEGGFGEGAFRRLVEYNIESGAHGFWVAGGAGESVLLDDVENARIAKAAADQASGRAKIIMHVGAPTTVRAARMAENAADAGVDAICAVPPFFYRPGPDEIVEHYRAVGAAAGLPLFLYNLPGATGVEITLELAGKIREHVPQLAGLKHSAPAFVNTRHFASMGLSCLIGSAALLLPALTIGASGCVDGPLALSPDVWVNIWTAYHDGDIKFAETEQRRAAELYTIFNRAGYIASMKALISEKLGIDCGDPRPPQRPLTSEEKAFVIRTAAALGMMEIESQDGD
ncbi:MAG: dihydrodipicolinate synthase family protein [Gemmatimonadota bacterium]|nr:dihydrodipicolinate synthase family protein [Gemmatimonadota bacterium]